LVMNETAK